MIKKAMRKSSFVCNTCPHIVQSKIFEEHGFIAGPSRKLNAQLTCFFFFGWGVTVK